MKPPLTMTRQPLLLTALLLGLSACDQPAEDTRPGQPVKTRQMAFKEILRVFEPMGVMLRTGEYKAEKFTQLAEQLVARRDAPWSHFGPDTNYPPSKSKPEVWSRAERFAQEKQAFLDATDQLLAAARSGEKGAITKAYGKVYDLCESCHEEFKKR